ncbi:hypothetical protein K3181_08695 [Qipengyuania sp. YG27]|uniref:MASP n=1 Tax=Qipengyuania mesophila TaxID=2867246 RepID=A0ABS7JVC1_9SPHN|nr:hypothetical protein [Qipengyuania mesophila]MBX7501519.1 hypothetical protein [Qipengyuania mesophila]
MTRFTAIAAALLATAGATGASAQLAAPVSGTVNAAAQAKIDPQPTLNQAQNAATRVGTTATNAAERAKTRVETATAKAQDKVEMAAEKAQDRAEEATDIGAGAKTRAKGSASAPGVDASVDAGVKAEADTNPEG